MVNYRRNRIRTIIIDVSRFVYFANQTSIFETETVKNNKLSKALDIIRRKHGAHSIHSASALGNVPKQKSQLTSKIQKLLPQDFTAIT
jgi:hypothetical protein